VDCACDASKCELTTRGRRDARDRDSSRLGQRSAGATPLALKTLQRITENPKAPASAKAQAAALVLDRGWGKMPVMEGEVQPQEIIVRWQGEGEGDDPAGRRARMREGLQG
jgi:hypothetical protein